MKKNFTKEEGVAATPKTLTEEDKAFLMASMDKFHFGPQEAAAYHFVSLLDSVKEMGKDAGKRVKEGKEALSMLQNVDKQAAEEFYSLSEEMAQHYIDRLAEMQEFLSKSVALMEYAKQINK